MPKHTTDGRSLGEAAYADLRDRVVSCAIAPGSWVSESQLAEELGVGKTPTREALRRLASEGFVEPIHRRGYQVAPITVARVLEIFEAFGMLVPEIAVLVSERASDEDKRRLSQLTRRWTTEDIDPGTFAVTPYRYFVSLCGNQAVIEMATAIVGHLERMFNFALAHGAFGDAVYAEALSAALDAIVDGRTEAARTAVRRLTDVTRESVIAALQSSPSLMTTPVEMVPDDTTTAA